MNRNSFATLGSLLSTAKIEELSKKIIVDENHKKVIDLHERMLARAKEMRLNLSNPASYQKVLKSLNK